MIYRRDRHCYFSLELVRFGIGGRIQKAITGPNASLSEIFQVYLTIKIAASFDNQNLHIQVSFQDVPLCHYLIAFCLLGS